MLVLKVPYSGLTLLVGWHECLWPAKTCGVCS